MLSTCSHGRSILHRFTLCFDIDGCLECILPSSPGMSAEYKQYIVKRIHALIFENIVDGKVCNAEVTLRLFTNRKDQCLDIRNMERNNTGTAKDMLHEMAGIIREWVDPQSSVLVIDDRFHVEQVFPPRDEKVLNYDTELRRISRLFDEDSPERLYRLGAMAGRNKIDLITTVLHKSSIPDEVPHTVVMFDDRFFENHEDNLNSVMGFLTATPEAIPQGLELKIIQLDPYLDRERLEQYVDQMQSMQKSSHATIQRQEDWDEIEASLAAQTDYLEVGKIPGLMKHFLYNRYDMKEEAAFESAMSQFQKALQVKAIMTGTGVPGRHFSYENCWSEFLIPVAKAYKEYLICPERYESNRSCLPEFITQVSNQSIFSNVESALGISHDADPQEESKDTPQEDDRMSECHT